MTDTNENASHKLRFSKDGFNVAVLMKAAHPFTRDLSFEFLDEGLNHIVTVRPLKHTEHDTFERLLDKYKIEALDQRLREIVTADTLEVRNAILAYAFSKTGLQG